MTISWTYMLHAYYRQKRIEYRYFDQKAMKKRFHRTRGALQILGARAVPQRGQEPDRQGHGE